MTLTTLFVSHLVNDEILARFDNLRRHDNASRSTHLLINGEAAAHREAIGDRPTVYVSNEALEALPYSAKMGLERFSVVPGNPDLLILAAARRLPPTDHYLYIEYDVGYAGEWSELLDALESSNSDFIATDFRRRSGCEAWMWWAGLKVPDGVAVPDPVATLNCLCRLSRRALDAIETGYLAGWGGHYECTIASMLEAKGLSVEDLRRHHDPAFRGPMAAQKDWYERRFFRALPAISDKQAVPRGQVFHPLKVPPPIASRIVATSTELAALDELLDADTELLEYGCGSSSLQAAAAGVRHIGSVDSDVAWLEHVSGALAERFEGVTHTPVASRIGDVGEWGHPVGPWGDAPNVEQALRFRHYALAPWVGDEFRTRPPNLVFIRGRFRVASFCASLMALRPGARIVFFNYGSRPHYHAAESLLAPSRRVGELAIFEVPTERPDMASLMSVYLEHCDDPR